MPAAAPGPDVPRPGDVLGGKYRVEATIGVGGMGAVVAARHVTLGHRVAAKVMLASAARLDGAVARFLREARAAAGLSSPHVCKVLDVGETDDGRPFMVMELLVGADLGAVLAQEELSISTAVDHVLQACEALSEAHARGIVHRDLKPSNLFLTTRADGAPQIKVLDFGISKVADEVDVSLTTTETALGTPLYMSPEQLRSLKSVDARTDVWALGVILHQLIARRLPFEGATLTALSAAIASDPPTPLRQHRADVPAALEAVVLRCLEKSPAARPAGVGELAHALAPFASPSSAWLLPRIDANAAGSPPPALPAFEPGAAMDTRSAWGRTRARGTTGRRWLVAAIALTSLGSLAGGVFLAWPRRPLAPAPSPASASAPSAAPAPTEASSGARAEAAPAASEPAAPPPPASSSPRPPNPRRVGGHPGNAVDPLKERH